MPMLDVFLPHGALSSEAERSLLEELTTILLRTEGADPDNPAVRPMAKAFVHRPEVFVAGAAAEKPHYRVLAAVPEGQLNGGERKQQLIAEVTDAVLRAEGSASDRDRARVWVFPLEIPEGHWGANGTALGLQDILAAAIGDTDKAQHVAQERIRGSRQEKSA